MAKTYSNLTEEELQEKIIMVIDHMIETKCSTRKAAKYATENGFPISNVGIHRIIHKKLPQISMEKYKSVLNIINNNSPKSIEDVKTKIRIYTAVGYVFQDFTIQEISDLLNSTPDIIYDDLTSRLPKLDKQIAKDVKLKLQEHKLENLVQYNQNVPIEVIQNQLEPDYEEKQNIAPSRGGGTR